MKKVMFVVVLLALGNVALAQKVSNARFVQEGELVKIYYDLSETSVVTIYLSTDGGKSYESSPIGHVSGHVGLQVPAGKERCAVWDVLSDRDKLQSNSVCFKIKAVRQGSNQTFTVGGVSFTMVYVKGGTFTMGCAKGTCMPIEEPAHSVTLDDYYMAQTEVTQALWVAVMGSNLSGTKGDNLPVHVSWEDAQRFIEKLNAMTGHAFRLPSEAEWEYAARGGSRSRGYRYAGSNNLDEVAWYSGNSNDKTHPVKQKRANELGLYDMSGNEWEMCNDWYGFYSSEPQTNPKGPSTGSARVSRGGGWSDSEDDSRVSSRNQITPSFKFDRIGLRLTLSY